ncbi:MAG: 3(2), 5-bisphosphate nucleotidase [Actinomycetota bacterium]|nr:3(2), 5-bisphosphate nucleotidase [Actinomycetota bacterium]
MNRDTGPGDHALATQLAAEAGSLLLRLRRELGDVAPDERGAQGDRRSHQLLVRCLGEVRPADAVLSEEAVDDPARLDSARVWVIDPLDGTREYADGRDDWAVHVALVADGGLVAGAVSVPCLSTTFSTRPPPAVPPREEGRALRMAVSRSRAPEVARTVARRLGAELVPMGSAGYKAMAVVRGEVDAYVHAGGLYEWDSAAPVAVALAAGLHASRLDGSPLRYNRPGAWLPDLVICRSELAGIVIEAASAASQA